MKEDTVIIKIWRVVYPVLLYFVLNLFVAFVVETVLGLIPSNKPLQDRVNENTTLTSIIFLFISLIVFYIIYKKDYVVQKNYVLKHPQYLTVLLLIGILASHGLSTMVSFLNIDGLLGSYAEIEAAVFSSEAILVIIRAVILAPLSEELVFRGIVYNRLNEYLGFWPAALISSAIFGFYHFNLAQGIFAFIFGVLLCAVYNKTRNLAGNVAVHMGGNIISVVLTYTGFVYPALWVYAVVMVAALAAAFLLYYFLIRPLKSKSL